MEISFLILLIAGFFGQALTNRLPQFSQEKMAMSQDEEQPIGKCIFNLNSC